MLHFGKSRLAHLVSVIAFAVISSAAATVARAQTAAEVLTNDHIKQMVIGKLSRDIILNKINTTQPGFDISANGITSMVEAKIDNRIIQEMLRVAENAPAGAATSASLIGIDDPLTNEDIIRMVTKKVNNSLVLTKIRISPNTFDVSTAGLVALNTNKVPEDLIKLMMITPKAPARRAAPRNDPVPAPGTTTPPAPAPSTSVTEANKKQASIAVYPFAAGTLPPTSRYDSPSGSMNVGLAARISQGFGKAGTWIVTDRSSDAAIAAEMDKSKSAANFRSDVILADNKKVNARYIMVGSIESAALTESKDTKGCVNYKVTVHFSAQIGDVQSGTVFSAKSFIATWKSINTETLKEVSKMKGVSSITRFGEKCRDSNSKEDAVEYALVDAKNQLADWAKSLIVRLPAK